MVSPLLLWLSVLMEALSAPLALRLQDDANFDVGTATQVQVHYVVLQGDVFPGHNADYLQFLGGVGDVGSTFKDALLDQYMGRLLVGSSGGFVVHSPWWAGTGNDMPKVVQMWFRSKTAGELLEASYSRHFCYPSSRNISEVYPRTYIVLPVSGNVSGVENFVQENNWPALMNCLRSRGVNLEEAEAMVAAHKQDRPAFNALIDHTVGPVVSAVSKFGRLSDEAFDYLAMQTVAGAGIVLQVVDLAEDVLKKITDSMVELIKKILEPIVKPIRDTLEPIITPFKDAIAAIMRYVSIGWNGVLPINPTTPTFKQLVHGLGDSVEGSRQRAIKIFKADPTRAEPHDLHQPGKVVEFLDSLSHDAVSHFLIGAATKVPGDSTCISALQSTPLDGPGAACMQWRPDARQCPENETSCCLGDGGAAACSAEPTCNGMQDASGLHAGGCSRGPCLFYKLEKRNLWNTKKDKNTPYLLFHSCDGSTRLGSVTVDLEKGEYIALDPVGVLVVKAKLDDSGKVILAIGLMVPGFKHTFSSNADLTLPLEILPDADSHAQVSDIDLSQMTAK